MNSKAIFPSYARYPITLVKGEGSLLWDDQGKQYLDFMSGLAVTNLGHAYEPVKKKLIEQLDQVWHVSNLFHQPNQEKLAELLTANSCADAVFFCNSGAEANEAAIKIARRYNQKVLGRDRYEVITFHQSFHGRTIATLTATGQDKVKEGFLPLPEGFKYAPYNDIEGLKAAISEKTCAIMLEFVQAEGGVIPADAEFIKGVVELCKEHDLLFIADEIQTGFGRTGKLFAYEHYGVEPDVVTLAKGLGNGFPIGAMMGKEKLIPAFTAGAHATTFGGTPIATSAAIAVVETMLEEGVADMAAARGEKLIGALQEKLAGHPMVEQVRGSGLLVGIVCKEPVAGLIADLQEAGLLAVPAGPNVLRLLPALNMPIDILEAGIEKIVGAFAARLATADSASLS